MNDKFDNYDQVDDTPTSSTEAFQQHLDDYARRLSNAISGMRRSDNRVSFTVDDSIITEIRDLASLEGISLSAMCSRLLTEYMTPEDSLGHWSK